MKDFSQLKKNLKKDFTGLKNISVALLGDSATQLLIQAIRAQGFEYGFNLEIWEADFNQIERQVFDPFSELYKLKPDVVIIFKSTHKLLGKYNKLKLEQHSLLAAIEIESLKDIGSAISKQLSAKILYYNYPEIDDAVFGSYANKVESSFLFQLRKLNYELMMFASQQENFYISDVSTVQNQIGKNALFHAPVYINTEMVFSIDALPYVAKKTVDVVAALFGKFKKCIILDLDNTTWGGIIGDDGIENIQIGSLGIGKAFSEFQYWVKKLKNRGIIVAVCSKNTESVAKQPFENHPEMVLRLEDIAVFVANWENKADNIRKIKETLNIGFDSMVFLDDNAFERNIVRENIEEITVPELSDDPAEYLEYLYGLNLFETASFSELDVKRNDLYRLEIERNNSQLSFANEADFLKSLNMVSTIEHFNKFNTPRVSQLSLRSNQYNLRTVRYDEADINRLSSINNYHTFAFTLSDKFGDHGLICVVVLVGEDAETAFIENWFMSCRVLKRGMEYFVLNTIVAYCIEKGYKCLKGEYIPTAKNELVKDHYLNLGFTQEDNVWKLALNEYKIVENHIN